MIEGLETEVLDLGNYVVEELMQFRRIHHDFEVSQMLKYCLT